MKREDIPKHLRHLTDEKLKALFYDDNLHNILTAKTVCLTRWLIQAKLHREDLQDIRLFLGL